MKIADVVAQLQLVLPKNTDVFSITLAIDSIIASSGVATITTTTAHNLASNQAVTIVGVGSNTPISGVSQDGLVFTFTTSSDHDLTYGWVDHETVSLRGFTDSAWNDSFTLTAVPNRREFKVRSTNTLPVLNGNEYLEEVRVDGVNGRFGITVTSATKFTVSSASITDGTYTGGSVKTAVRIAGSVTIDRAKEEYTRQGASDFWMFVIPIDPETSKDRNSHSDAVSTKTSGDEMRLRILDGFDIIIIKNVSNEAAAVDAVDTCRHDLFEPIMKAIYGITFPTGSATPGDFRIIPIGHGRESYDKARLVYIYQFQMPFDLTDSDVVEPADTSAFRDIDYTQGIGGDDTEDMTANIDLDDEPI
jgi:hypothetical protein